MYLIEMSHSEKKKFRGSLTNKKCKTIEVCIAEGKFAGIFGWSLTHTPVGGFLGLPGIILIKLL